MSAARQIAATLVDPPPAWAPVGSDETYRRVSNASIGFGRGGIALLLGYLARTDAQSESLGPVARRFAGEVAELAGREVLGPSLYNGFAGIGWLLMQLHEWGLVSVDDDSLRPIDEAILTFLDRRPWPWHFDVVNGLCGVAVYALERLPSPAARDALERVVGHFEDLAEEHEDGLTWFSPPRLLQPGELERGPHGYYNLGMAHGVPGVISTLADVAAADVAVPRVSRLLAGSVPWLLNRRLAGTQNFPYVLGREVEAKPARLGWCYGAPGIAAAVWKAGASIDRKDWRGEALRLGRWAAEVEADASGVVDAAICHGAAGLAHIFNRLHQWSGEEVFSAAARYWIDRVFEHRVEGLGLAGFRSHNPDPAATEPWFDSPGMLTGAAGVGAVLAAAASDLSPSWDRMFLLGGPAVE